jgi:hypothetical protein
MERPRHRLSLLAHAPAFASSVAGRAVWLALATMLSASAASAAGPSLGDHPAPYQQYAAASVCSTGSCGITFPAVTADTLISQVSCYFYSTNTDGAYDAYLWNGVSGAGAIYNHLPPIQTGIYNGESTYAINAPTEMFLTSGQQPSVSVLNFVGTIPQFDCSLSGYTGPQPAQYQQYVSTTDCGSSFCATVFPPVTAATLISQVTCYFAVPNTAVVYVAELSNAAPGLAPSAKNFFLPIETGIDNGNAYYVINAQTQLFLSSEQTPTVAMFDSVGTPSSLVCSVSGHTGSQLAARAGIAPPPSAGPMPASAASAAGPILPSQPVLYQNYGVVPNCSAGHCTVAFPAVTADTLISQVTCYLYLTNTAPVYAANLSNGVSGAGQLVNWLPAIMGGTANGDTAYVINAQTQMLLSSGQTPSVTAFNSVGTLSDLECAVSGYTGSKLAARAGPAPPSGEPVPAPAGGPLPPSSGSAPAFFPGATGQ